MIKIYIDDLIERLPHEPKPPVLMKTSLRGRGLGSKDIIGRRRQDEGQKSIPYNVIREIIRKTIAGYVGMQF